MPKDRLAEQLAEIRALAAEPRSPATIAALRVALAKRPSHVVALAAGHVAEHGLRELAEDVARAYERLAEGGVKADPGCAGKVAAIRTLSALNHADPAPFEHGVDLIQLEKGFGKPVDTAIHVRGEALMGMVGLGLVQTPTKIAERLADPEIRVRAAAIRCAVAWGDPALARALIVLRLALGEKEPEVFEEAYAALIGLGEVDRVVAALDGRGEAAECAALALGAARVALPALIAWWTRAIRREQRQIALVAIGLTREPAALAFLLERLADRPPAGQDALEALGVFLPDPAARVRIVAAAEPHGLAVPEAE